MTKKNDTKSSHLLVSGSTNVQSLAGAIANGLYEDKRIFLRSVGAGALNQSVKGLVKARSFISSTRGWDLRVVPSMETVTFHNESGPEDRSAIVLKVEVVEG